MRETLFKAKRLDGGDWWKRENIVVIGSSHDGEVGNG